MLAQRWECDGEPQGNLEAVEVYVLPGVLRLQAAALMGSEVVLGCTRLYNSADAFG